MSSALNNYFRSYVDPHRGTVLVQGGHKSGKTTLLNALLGYHALPYFAAAPPTQQQQEDGNPKDATHHAALPVHGMTTSRYTAGPGSTAVCILNAAAVKPSNNGSSNEPPATLEITKPESGSIQHLIAPSSMLFTGFTRPGETPVPPEITKTTKILHSANSRQNSTNFGVPVAGMGGEQNSASINDPLAACGDGSGSSAVNLGQDTSAFCFVEKVYTNDFDVVGEVDTSAGATDPWEARTQQAFYYDAVSAMESSWKEWAVDLQKEIQLQQQQGKKIDPAVDAPERMLFVVGVNQNGDGDSQPRAKDFSTIHPDAIPIGAESLPPLHCVESTDLADRPPMTYVHSSVVVLTDTHDAPRANNDQDGARRMYVQSALFTRANNEPCLVYNLVRGSLNTMTTAEVEELRQQLSRIWNVAPVCIYIFSLRNALADMMLSHEGIPSMNPKDSAELNRLRDMITTQHILAHERFCERVVVARKKFQLKVKQEVASTGTATATATTACAATTTATTDYVPKILTPEFKSEGVQVTAAVVAATTSTGTATTSTSTASAGTSTATAEQVVARNSVLNNEAAKVSHEVLKRQTDFTPKCCAGQSGAPTTSTMDSYEPKCLQSNATTTHSDSYVPKVLGGGSNTTAASGAESYIPVCLRQVAPTSNNQQESYVPKCVRNESFNKPNWSDARYQIKVGSSTSPTPTETREILVAPCDPAPAPPEAATLAVTSSPSPKPRKSTTPQPVPRELHALFTAEEWMNMSAKEYDRIVTKYLETHPQEAEAKIDGDQNEEKEKEHVTNASSPSVDCCSDANSSFDYLEDEV